jgi:hypothetical protein
MMPELGRQRVFQLAPEGGRLDERRGLDRDWRGRILGDPPADFSTLQQSFEAGWRFSAYDLHEAVPSDRALIVVRPSGAISFITCEGQEEAVAALGRSICQRLPSSEESETPAQENPAAALLA